MVTKTLTTWITVLGNSLVLFCVDDCKWKITDFGLTSEGTSMRAHSTRSANGTGGYRSPELVREARIVSKESDIFALGCMIYELVAAERAFSSDISVFTYFNTKQKPKLPPLSAVCKTRFSLDLLINAMLDVSWWKRPSAGDVTHVLESLSLETTEVSVWVDPAGNRKIEKTGPSIRLLGIDNALWEHVVWLPYW